MRRAFLALAVLAASAAAQDTFSGVSRIVAVGDVHGDLAAFTQILRDASVIDAANKWAGGKTHLVQTGDVPDRGPDTRKILDLLIDLEKQAKKAGGQVHALLGNHEAMNIYGDLRYVSPGEYESFKTAKSAELREEVLKLSAPEGKIEAAFREKWEASRPLGWVEHRRAFSAEGKYGQWLLKHNAIIKINDTLFLHGGIGPAYAAKKIREINNQIRDELRELKVEGGAAADPEGPLWYRGLASGDEAALASHVDSVLAFHGASRIVIGHTPMLNGVTPRFGGKVVLIDVGLSKTYGGPPACLVIENGKARAILRGQPVELPSP